MPRPEKQISGDGPVAELARALRALRARAGLTYDQMAATGLCSKPSLAAAATGNRCPTWYVTEAYARACGVDPETVRPLWDEAGRAERRQRARRPLAAAPVKRLRGGSAAGKKPVRITREPDPWTAQTVQEFVWLLRALRAWAGQRGTWEVYLESSKHRLPSSTLYAALDETRTQLPRLEVVQAVVRSCDADVANWTAAYQDLSLREFEVRNPRPGQRQWAAGVGPGAVVRPLERPAQ
jgi:helix-turn-helix protein